MTVNALRAKCHAGVGPGSSEGLGTAASEVGGVTS